MENEINHIHIKNNRKFGNWVEVGNFTNFPLLYSIILENGENCSYTWNCNIHPTTETV